MKFDEKFDEQVKNLPQTSGVYLFRDQAANPLYVGKATNLRDRVCSYFQESADLGSKTQLMVSQIAKIEHFETETEIEALLLEADLIKRLKPKYNRRLKDNKAFPLIKITRETFPRVTIARKKDEKATYFGPFPRGSIVKVLRIIRRAFPYRSCPKAKFERYKKLGRGCLFFDLELCPAPCLGQISPEDYKNQISELKKFLRGRGEKIIQNLKLKMQNEAEEKNFEEALMLRDKILRLNYIRQKFRTPDVSELDINLPEDQRQKELEELQVVLGLSRVPKRIEAYDISNISGKMATGSMVVFENGEAKKDHYRRFKIRLGEEPNDVGMIKEILERRFKRATTALSNHSKFISESNTIPETGSDRALNQVQGDRKIDRSFEMVPDLILVDGGKGQLNAAFEVIKEKGMKIPAAALAKREEQIYFCAHTAVEGKCGSILMQGPIRLPRDSRALQLLQRIRDESHRFALFYHRKLRSKEMV